MPLKVSSVSINHTLVFMIVSSNISSDISFLSYSPDYNKHEVTTLQVLKAEQEMLTLTVHLILN